MIKEISSLVRSIASLVSIGGGVIILGGVIIIYGLFWGFPEVWFLGSIILRLPDLRWLIGLGVGLLGIGSVMKGEYRHVSGDYYKTRLVIAGMLAYFGKYSFSLLNKSGWWGMVGVGIIIFWFSGVISTSSEKWNIKQEIANIKTKRRYVIYALVIIGLVIGIIGKVSMVTQRISQEKAEKQAWLSNHPMIKVVEPRIVFASNKVVVRGKHFGWQENKKERVKLVSDKGRVTANVWTNEKIVFTIPLEWQGERVKIWVEKERQWKGEEIKDRSEKVTITVLNRNKVSKEEENAYYQELQKASREAQQLNGY